jgi:thiamine biosynthesis lipoprotein ApbE
MGAEKGQNWAESKPGVETMIILHSDHGFKEKMSGGFKAFLDTSGPK